MMDAIKKLDWSLEEKIQLLNTILEMGSLSKQKSYKTEEASLKWEDVKMDGRSPEECKIMYQTLISKVRKYRTMPEIIQDALKGVAERTKKLHEAFPDLPRKPPTAFSLFIRKKAKKYSDIKGSERMKLFASDWNDLSDEKKEAYKKKYMKLKKQYEEELEIYRQNHPDFVTEEMAANRPQPPQPFRLFIESRLDRFKSKHPQVSHAEAVKLLTIKYKELPDKKKLKWIDKAKESMHKYQVQFQQYLANNPNLSNKPVVFHLSKDEQRIWNSSRGLVAPPKNVFMYFCNINRDSLQQLNIAEQSKKLAELYHNLNEEEMKDLVLKFKQDVEEYVQRYMQHYVSLPEEERILEKSPEEALAVYNRILLAGSKKKKKKRPELKKNRLSKNKVRLAPAINADMNDVSEDSDDQSSSTSSQETHSLKRKLNSQNNASTHNKKLRLDPEEVKEEPESGSRSDTSGPSSPVDEDALLSLWSPTRSKPSKAASVTQLAPKTPTKKTSKN